MSLLPKNASRFERNLALVCKPNMQSPIRSLLNPDLCPPDLLYVMALTLQVDTWDENWPLDAKINTLKDVWNVHRTRGTPSSLKRVLRNSGYGDARLEEDPSDSETWYQYHVYLARPVTNKQAKQVLKMLEDAAPLHCVLVGLHFDEVAFTYNGEIQHDGDYSYGTASSAPELKRRVLSGELS